MWRRGVVVEADAEIQNPETGLFSESSDPASCFQAHPACTLSDQLLFQLSKDGYSTTYPVVCSRTTSPWHLEVFAFKEWRQERGDSKVGRQAEQVRAEDMQGSWRWEPSSHITLLHTPKRWEHWKGEPAIWNHPHGSPGWQSEGSYSSPRKRQESRHSLPLMSSVPFCIPHALSKSLLFKPFLGCREILGSPSGLRSK